MRPKLSPALGAFVAGMFLGNSKFAVQIRADVSSSRIVLLTLFFGAVGMIADPVWMFKNLPTVLSLAAMILVGKAVIIWGMFRLFGQASGVSLSTGLCLCQVGEFAFVLGSEARTGRTSFGYTVFRDRVGFDRDADGDSMADQRRLRRLPRG